MAKHVVIPTTYKRREKLFKKNYEKWVNHQQERGKVNIINLAFVRKRLKKGLGIIANFKNFSQREILRRKALYLNREAGYMTDALIDATVGMEKYKRMHPKLKSQLWAKTYSDVVETILGRIIKDPQLKEATERMDLYFALPSNIHKQRGNKKRWLHFKQIREKIIKSGVNPRENLVQKTDKIMSRRKPGESYRIKAMDVCVAASIYADVLKKTSGSKWTLSYREGMEIAYSRISTDERLVDAIVNLSKSHQ